MVSLVRKVLLRLRYRQISTAFAETSFISTDDILAMAGNLLFILSMIEMLDDTEASKTRWTDDWKAAPYVLKKPNRIPIIARPIFRGRAMIFEPRRAERSVLVFSLKFQESRRTLTIMSDIHASALNENIDQWHDCIWLDTISYHSTFKQPQLPALIIE